MIWSEDEELAKARELYDFRVGMGHLELVPRDGASALDLLKGGGQLFAMDEPFDLLKADGPSRNAATLQREMGERRGAQQARREHRASGASGPAPGRDHLVLQPGQSGKRRWIAPPGHHASKHREMARHLRRLANHPVHRLRDPEGAREAAKAADAHEEAADMHEAADKSGKPHHAARAKEASVRANAHDIPRYAKPDDPAFASRIALTRQRHRAQDAIDDEKARGEMRGPRRVVANVKHHLGFGKSEEWWQDGPDRPAGNMRSLWDRW